MLYPSEEAVKVPASLVLPDPGKRENAFAKNGDVYSELFFETGEVFFEIPCPLFDSGGNLR